MSSPTPPITDPAPVAPPISGGFHDAISAARMSGGEDPRAIDLTGDGPPPEVLDQMAQADTINARLRESGRELCFALSADGCSLQIELRDTAGELIRVLSAEEASAIAAGELPE
jgi:hypothetical protein